MLCRRSFKKTIPLLLIAVGVASLAFGVAADAFAQPGNPDWDHFWGMLTGFGTGLIAAGLFFLLRFRLMSPEKRKAWEVAQNDERNIAIHRAAFTVSAIAAFLLFPALAFAFVAMGLRLQGYLCIAAMYVQLLTYLVAAMVCRKKM